MLTGMRKVGKQFALSYTLSINEVKSLTGPLDKAAPSKHLRNSPVARILLPKQIFLIDPNREATWADNFEPPWKLSYKDGTAQAIVAVAHSVQHSLTNSSFLKSRYIPDEKSLLEVLKVVSQIDQPPDLIKHRQKSAAKFMPIWRGPRHLVGSVFEHNLGLPKMSA